MIKKKRILIIASKSNNKSELISGNNLLFKALVDIGFETNLFIFKKFNDLITKLKSYKPDLVFNLFLNTEDDISTQMQLTGILEIMKIPYIGNTPFVLGLSIMKNFIKRLLENKRIPSIPYQIYRKIPEKTYLKFPVFLRPANMDWPTARLRAAKISDFSALQLKVANYLKQYKHPALIESLIPGRIYFVGIFGNTKSQVLPVCEAIGVGSKYKFKCPADIDNELGFHLRDIALHVFKYLMGKDYALISFLIDNKKQIYVADYHPNPSLLIDSIFQLGFKVSDFEFKAFLQLIINEAFEKNENDKS